MLSSRLFINRPKIVDETIDGEVVLINLDTGSYYSADKTGAEIWACIGQQATADEIVALMLQQYSGSASEIEKAIRDFLDHLLKEDIIGLDGAAESISIASVALPHAGRKTFTAPSLQKYDDMQDLLLADPIHDFDEAGWPHQKQPEPPAGKQP